MAGSCVRLKTDSHSSCSSAVTSTASACAAAGLLPITSFVLAVAILTDALVVKMTLVPAFFTWLGEKTWYMPRWLDKVLPNITIEAPHDGGPVARVEVERPAERPI